MSAKTSTQRRKGAKVKVRKCLRCGCTEDNACPQLRVSPGFHITPGNCAWVHHSDVCDACLTRPEWDMYQHLLELLQRANTNRTRHSAVRRLQIFGKFVDDISPDMPIPFEPAPDMASGPEIKFVKGGGK